MNGEDDLYNYDLMDGVPDLGVGGDENLNFGQLLAFGDVGGDDGAAWVDEGRERFGTGGP